MLPVKLSYPGVLLYDRFWVVLKFFQWLWNRFSDVICEVMSITQTDTLWRQLWSHVYSFAPILVYKIGEANSTFPNGYIECYSFIYTFRRKYKKIIREKWKW